MSTSFSLFGIVILFGGGALLVFLVVMVFKWLFGGRGDS